MAPPFFQNSELEKRLALHNVAESFESESTMRNRIVAFFLYLIAWSDTGFSRLVHVHKDGILSSNKNDHDAMMIYESSQSKEAEGKNHTMRFQQSKAKEPVIASIAVTIGIMWAIGAGIKILTHVVGEVYDKFARRRYVEALRKSLASTMGDQKAKMCSPFLDVFRGMFERIESHDASLIRTATSAAEQRILNQAKNQLCSALLQYKEDHFKRALYSCFTIDSEGNVFTLEKYYEMKCATTGESAPEPVESVEEVTPVEEEASLDLCSWDQYLQFCEQTYESSEEVTSFKLIQEDMFDLETDQCVLWRFCRKKYTRDCSGSKKFDRSGVVNDSPCCVTEDCTNDYKILRAYAELRDSIAPRNGAVYTPDLEPRHGLLVAGESCSRVRNGELLFEGEYCQPAGEDGKLVAFRCMDGRCTWCSSVSYRSMARVGLWHKSVYGVAYKHCATVS